MGLWMRAILLCCLLGIAGTVLAGSAVPEQFSMEVGAEQYDCLLNLLPAKTIAPGSALVLQLEWNGNTWTGITLTPKFITIETVVNGKPGQQWKVNADVTPGTPYALTVIRRGDVLGLQRGETLIFRAQVPRAPGSEAGILAGAGWTVIESRVQPLEPVVFADNFMRSPNSKNSKDAQKNELGAWTPQSGTWQLQSAWDKDALGNANRFTFTQFAQNPFAWVGGNPNGPALCTTGKPFWEDYMLTASLCPPVNGAIGVAVNMRDAKNGLLLRWSPANDHSALGGQLTLFRLVAGQRTLITQSRGGYLPGQWYKFEVDSRLDGLRVSIDGQVRLTVTNLTPWRGGIGLYAEGARGAVFDDVTAYGHALNTDMIVESQQKRLSRRILDDPMMQEWAKDWVPYPGQQAVYQYQHEFYGDHRLALVLTPTQASGGELWLGLNNDGKNPALGNRAVIQREEDGKTAYSIYRDSTLLASRSGDALQANEEYSLRLHRAGPRLWLEVDGEKVVEAIDPQAPTGWRPFFRADGAFTQTRDAVAMGHNVLDYLFADAPVDWIGEGTWMPSVRWSCEPKWSFLGGWSHGDVVLWHKQQFSGDHSFEAYLGVKMEYPRSRQTYDYRYRNLAITICGDGHNPRSGYAAILGAPDPLGTPNKRTVLLRNGVEVGTVGIALPDKDRGHRDWFHLELRKHGNTVELWVEGKQAITFEDPQPLVGGVPAIWTDDNGIMLARARLRFANPPKPRRETRITLDQPDYPEWLNVGQALPLSFATACSTTGNTPRLQVASHAAPSGERAVTINGLRASCTPTKPGTHWYQFTARDGDAVSPSAHLLLPVFNAKVGRDDSHAILLYRFNEAPGKVVHDVSKTAPALDLTILAPEKVRWLPQQGLELFTSTTLTSIARAEKLNAIAKNKACTFEFWVSPSTLYVSPGWESSLFAWENNNTERNFALGCHSGTFAVTAGPGSALQLINPHTIPFPGFRIGLLHVVITWDGTLTSCYFNGQKSAVKPFNWRQELWTSNTPLLLGNQYDGMRPFLGTYYLVAVHDRAFTPTEVIRHYQAGPAAK